ncbi:MAG: hypothetical protein L0287_16470 [Anaerolineae bacterium]|nr:hypothetical protein [Anaerolineae bacterium]MCI0608429.1 hypothetical protein [Anaerolineae bacterium]
MWFQAPGITVRAPSLEQLLARKLSAWRDDLDISDARRLLQEVATGRKRDELTAQYAFLDLWETLYGTD